MVYNSIIDSIGNTPVVRLRSCISGKIVIYAKLEGQNPGGSVKDRVAVAMIEAAEKKGLLDGDKVILEPTSGNTGIGLAMVGIAKGYPVMLTMSAAMSSERKTILRAMGAKIVETDPALGTDGAIDEARRIFSEDPGRYWMPFQFDNPANIEAHYRTTAPEIIRQVPDITCFVAAIGTTGTLMGVGKRLKEYNPDICIVGVEPEKDHRIQGLKNLLEAIVPGIYDPSVPDKIIEVTTEEAYQATRDLALQEGIVAGMSSGAALFGARKIAKELHEGKIVVIFPDRGEKYLSTPLFQQ
ncbi:MAG TPA: PLP-dependent cysteine synthase family protein [Bacteroidetes bacterium]|nr:PLP-dependent cysteine synthase family protein [Bacteroidota bacterium]